MWYIGDDWRAAAEVCSNDFVGGILGGGFDAAPCRPDLFRIICFAQTRQVHDFALDRARLKPNVRMSLGQFQGERSLRAALQARKPLFWLPLHEYEMTHDHGGNRTGQLLHGNNRKQFDNKQMMPLLWGEDFLLTEPMIAFTK